MNKLSHISENGEASMVDVSAKPVQRREASACGFVKMSVKTVRLVRENGIKKGDVLAVARIAGIQGAKRTQELVPLCHQIPLSHVGIDFEILDTGIAIVCSTRTSAQTGVEMEALTGVSVAALTIYDMCKAVDKEMVIEGIRVTEKIKE
jgi:cyclic pyranopterin phosphate synthase